MNRYDTRIFEMHNKAGGLCTAWKRGGYTISTPGWVTGSAPANNAFYRFWQELGAVRNRDFVDYEEYARFQGGNGQVFVLYTDIDRLQQHMLELTPEDEATIIEFVQVLRAFTQFSMPVDVPPELSGPPALPQLPPFMMKWMGMSIRDMPNQFQNPFLRQVMAEAFPIVLFDPGISAVFLLSTLASMYLKTSRYPVGGALDFVGAIERRYQDLGGEVYYRSPVSEILVEAQPRGEGDRAVGVRLEDGTEHRADIVVSAADGHTTIFDMLGGKYVNEEIRTRYEALPLYEPLLFISLGVNRCP